jgi:recombination protein U
MKYPTGIKKKINHLKTSANRGMDLENEVNLSNIYYLETNRAVIHKKPTPIRINKYNKKLNRISDAYFEAPSTTDYNGIYKGKYIDFDAKVTANATSFPLANIHAHQIEHLTKITKQGGIGFLIIRFSKLNITYLLKADSLISFINNNERKSIPIEYIKDEGYIVKQGLRPALNYLNCIDKIMEENNEKEN